ncbi:o-succinylbenzoate synthase [Loigolactobacillus backii]|uniref:o-succinylbenzoate synthase n=1 Tax=Loigolactobacillus backii TaxID=375175 RepID=UPI0022FD441D|nr:o-succinylbenzoate synthase [Loigolactobacillus backii]MDA5386706.1 o-succinylbenzoate synthase [Loigolactobacillus backii]MDA5389231.1 o-succinylbenzoate synthase [Loigolactobacillus backii]
MQIKKIRLLPVTLPLISSFKTSEDNLNTREVTLVQVSTTTGLSGLGELEAFAHPTYTAETQATARQMIQQEIVPLLTDFQFALPEELSQHLAVIQGNQMAKAAVETAVWDLYAQSQQKSLAAVLAQRLQVRPRRQIAVGVSIGQQPSVDQLLQKIQLYLNQGYQRIKLKITGVAEIAMVEHVRQQFPKLNLMVDANSAFTLTELPALRRLDKLNLAMIEQPLATDDFVQHAHLQKQLTTSLCLDENIFGLADVATAVTLKSARAINLKLARVGGLTNTLAIVQYCQKQRIEVWCGGMLETGVGRAANLALASLPLFTFPGDISASDRYFSEDVIQKPFELAQGGRLTVPDQAGLGVNLTAKYLGKMAEQTWIGVN